LRRATFGLAGAKASRPLPHLLMRDSLPFAVGTETRTRYAHSLLSTYPSAPEFFYPTLLLFLSSISEAKLLTTKARSGRSDWLRVQTTFVYSPDGETDACCGPPMPWRVGASGSVSVHPRPPAALPLPCATPLFFSLTCVCSHDPFQCWHHTTTSHSTPTGPLQHSSQGRFQECPARLS
jgi:hypothetical protein